MRNLLVCAKQYKNLYIALCILAIFQINCLDKMRKIGVLSYHNNNNKGGILQAYCLVKSLKENISDSSVEIIDYRTISREFKRIFAFNPFTFVKNTLNYNICTNFFKEQNMLSKDKIITNDYKKTIYFLKKQNYDMIVVGSDQIWRLEKGNLILTHHVPFPNAYVLHPSLKAIKVSYAASANRMPYEFLSGLDKNIFKKNLSAFDKISVREKHTEKILTKLGFNNVVRVPDPTLLTDIPKTNVQRLLESNKINLDKPIIGIDRLNRDLSKKITDIYHQKGYQVVTPTFDKNADVELSILRPLEYFSIFSNFDMVITRSYHSTIFSIKNKIPFATINPTPKCNGDKLYCLLDDLELLDRHIDITNGIPNDFFKRINKCEKPLSKNLNSVLEKLKGKGIKYIQDLNVLLDEKIT